jgi:sRNA-binding protein
MSSVLRDMLGDEEEYYDDYSDEDQQQYYDEEPYPEDEEQYDEEEQEQLSKGVNLLELAQAQKTSAPAPKKKKPKKTQQQNVIEYRDISEFEYYENLKLGKTAKTAKVLDSIKYKLQAIESVKMSLDTFQITDLQIMTVNPAWIKRKVRVDY